mmetsp:Transcript_24663/g.73993  ORF Transcript_24663/g.73993 Transcript_24663/m.73993 type:complete len:200 (+) Transcript_24663:3887-4486(+)
MGCCLVEQIDDRIDDLVRYIGRHLPRGFEERLRPPLPKLVITASQKLVLLCFTGNGLGVEMVDEVVEVLHCLLLLRILPHEFDVRVRHRRVGRGECILRLLDWVASEEHDQILMRPFKTERAANSGFTLITTQKAKLDPHLQVVFRLKDQRADLKNREPHVNVVLAPKQALLPRLVDLYFVGFITPVVRMFVFHHFFQF